MGLIKAGLGALGGTLADQWKEFFYCDSIDNDLLMVKGQKRTGSRSSNTKGEDNIISNGSLIAVADGQAMMIVEQGKVVEFCAEPGEFTYDTSTEPSIFAGSLGESIKETFKTIGKRFTFGGDTAKDQRVYYFNTKEIMGNKYGTATPIPFRVVINEQMGLKLSVDIRCNGEYTYKLTNPLLFYTNIAGNVSDSYEKSEWEDILRSSLLDALQPALAQVAAQRIEYFELPGHTVEIRNALTEVLKPDWTETRGIELVKLTINSLSIPEDQRKKITEWEENAMTTNPMMAGSRLVGAQADAMRTAAANENGAMQGFMGMGMAMNAGGMNAQNLFSMGQQQQAVPNPQAAATPDAAMGWKCACGAVNTGKFCAECGAQKPMAEGWKCACGAVNKGKFCPECGAKKPAGVPQYKCDKCGWEPEDPQNPPKFCPECGDRFDESDAN
ncbi:MAG: SPFH domain-containing protein [Ruminococcaceae bacterium]|nr:SPFH domain-containing protein [Oscillospiraceae bacterium]